MNATLRRGGLAYGLAIFVIVVDQAVKYWMIDGLGLVGGFSRDVWGPLRLTLVENQGVSFGLFQSSAPWTRWALAAFSLAVAIGLGVWARRAEKPLTELAVGLIIGGALGNFIDRVLRGSVVDFVDVQSLHFPWIFNVADSAITVGIALLMVESLMSSPKPQP